MSLSLALPFVAAIIWGLVYVLWEKALATVSVPTMFAVGAVLGLIIAMVMAVITKEPIDLKTLSHDRMWAWVLLALLLAQVASYITTYVTKSNGALFSAIGEVSYPLFIPLFSLLILGTSQLTLATALGGGMIVAGAFLIVWGKL
jgi:drug/metabolite transporter (DMT)-like permease